MNFAPYQDESPEVERALSPPPPDGILRSKSPPARAPRFTSPVPTSGVHATERNYSGGHEQGNIITSGFGNDVEHGGTYSNGGARASLGAFETSLPMRMDFEAMMAYLLLPPAGGVFLLLFEHKSDYVRFHAWQSSMLFSAIFILHLIFAWSSVISWLMFTCDIFLIGFLSVHAYRDVDSLEHFELPFFGRLANSFVDDE